MELSAAGLFEQPFRTHGKPSALCSYAGHRSALEFLEKTYAEKHGLALFQGPTLSGKSTILQQFIDSLHPEASAAIVDGNGLDTTGLLQQVLAQYGYRLELTSDNELASMLRVFAMQQTVAGNPPLLVIENTHLMTGDVLRVVAQLAEAKANRQSALRMVLVSDRSVSHILKAPAMESVAKRVTGLHRLEPMAALETRDYLHAKLVAAGSLEPASIMPDTVCADIYSASSGWPGVVDRLAILALAKADSCPITGAHVERRRLPDEPSHAEAELVTVPSTVELDPDGPPRIFLTRAGKFLGDVSLDAPRLLVGRSEHNDLRINSEFISRHHMMLVRHGSATLLMDLNSTNGSFVNSRRVSNYVLNHDDVISLGNHRLKFVHPAAEASVEVDEAGIAETVIMKTLDDMRRMLKGESTATMPMKSIEKLVKVDKD